MSSAMVISSMALARAISKTTSKHSMNFSTFFFWFSVSQEEFFFRCFHCIKMGSSFLNVDNSELL